MVSYTDSLNVVIRAQVDQAVAAIGAVKNSMSTLGKMYSRVQGIMASANAARFMGTELNKVGITVEKGALGFNQYRDSLGRYTSKQKALKSVTENLNDVQQTQYDAQIKSKNLISEKKNLLNNLGVTQASITKNIMKQTGAQNILNEVTKEVRTEGTDKLYKSVMQTNNILPKTTAKFKEMDQVMSKVGKNARGNMMKFMGLGFAFMFIGMAIKKAVSSALNAIVETYKLATGEQSEFNQQMNKLGAAFEFFKFSLMDAIGSLGVFDVIIGFVIGLINWFAKMPASVRIFILIALAGLLVAASIAAIAGQFLLLAASGSVNMGIFFSLFAFAWASIMLIILAIYLLVTVWTDSTKTIVDQIFYAILIVGLLIIAIILIGIALGVIKGAAIITAASIVAALLKIIIVAVLIYLAWLAVKAIWTNASLDMVNKVLLIIGVLGLLVFAIAAIVFGVILWPLAVVAVILLIIGALWMFKDAFWDLLKSLFKALISILIAMFNGWKRTFIAIFNLVLGVIKGLFKIFINFWVWLAAWLALLFLNWELIWKKVGQAIVNAILTAMVWVAKKIDDVINGIVNTVNKILPKKWEIKFKSNISETMEEAKDNMSDVFGIAKTEQKIKIVEGVRDNAAKNMGEGIKDIVDSGKDFINEMTSIGEDSLSIISKNFKDVGGAFKQFGSDVKDRVTEIREGFSKKTDAATGAAPTTPEGQTFFGQDPNTFTSQMPEPDAQANNLELQGLQDKANSLMSNSLVEQQASNDKLDKLNETLKEGITIIEMPEIGKFEYAGVNLEDGMEEINSQYNGSTTN